ncbi:MAG TPA: hypothetical protein VGX76_19540 [Pirellulales bacterium]|nr:hypothetical protein [Pirellulales bacterium]
MLRSQTFDPNTNKGQSVLLPLPVGQVAAVTIEFRFAFDLKIDLRFFRQGLVDLRMFRDVPRELGGKLQLFVGELLRINHVGQDAENPLAFDDRRITHSLVPET